MVGFVVAQACSISSMANFLSLSKLIVSFDNKGYDVVGMVLADQIIGHAEVYEENEEWARSHGWRKTRHRFI